MAPVCEVKVSSCRRRENDSVFSSASSLVIVMSKHSLRDCGSVGDPGLLKNIKEIDRNAVNLVKSLPAPNHYNKII